MTMPDNPIPRDTLAGALAAYRDEFGPVPVSTITMSDAEKAKLRDLLDKAVERGSPLTDKEIKRMEPDIPGDALL
jgi:hypothetical protein